MSYIDGFVIAVPKANKQKFIEHANQGDSVFVELGATRILECWGDDVPDGKVTDFRRAVQANDDEAVAELFRGPHATFVAERKRLAGELKAAGDKAGAATLIAARRTAKRMLRADKNLAVMAKV